MSQVVLCAGAIIFLYFLIKWSFRIFAVITITALGKMAYEKENKSKIKTKEV